MRIMSNWGLYSLDIWLLFTASNISSVVEKGNFQYTLSYSFNLLVPFIAINGTHQSFQGFHMPFHFTKSMCSMSHIINWTYQILQGIAMSNDFRERMFPKNV